MPAAQRKPKAPRPSKKRRAPALADALAEAVWAEADAALAEALVELDQAERARSAAQRGAAMAMLSQALARAARKRGLARIGELDAREPFDPKRHDLDSIASRTPKMVCIEARGVARGSQVLVKPRVGPVRRKPA